MPWTFKDRLDSRGINVIREWLQAQPLQARLKIDAVLKNLRAEPRLGRPHVKKIKGHKDVFEIVVFAGGVQYRPLGSYGPHEGEFTIVMGAIEHNDSIRPPDAFATAERHIKSLKAGTLRTCNHDYEQPHPSAS